MKPCFAIAALGLAGVTGFAVFGTGDWSGNDDAYPFSHGWFTSSDSGQNPMGQYVMGCSRVIEPDYHQRAADTQWAFHDAEATLQFCLAKPQSRYTLAATSSVATNVDRLTVRVSQQGSEVFAFPADEHTVFDIIGHRLYYSEPGATVVSVDLTTGTELWRTKLKGVGDGTAAHLNLKADEDGLTVIGREPAGKYVEVLDAETGETAGHKVVEN
jgi:hypothetical protein